MMTLTLIWHPSNGDGGYRSTLDGEWMPGETREVSDDHAAELLADWPGAFALPESAPKAADLSPLDAPVRDLIPRIKDGELDETLDALLDAEINGKARTTITAAIRSRIASMAV